MTGYLLDSRGRLIVKQQMRDAFELLSLTKLYGNWCYAIAVASNGRPCEMFTRL